MKKQLRNILIFIAPFLIMILINELVRPTIKEKSYKIYTIQAMNSAEPFEEKCSWACYQNTAFCKRYHTKTLAVLFPLIDPIYNGIINSMQGTKNYSYATINVFIFVILLPFLMFLLLIKILDMQSQINLLKSKS